MKYFLLQFLIFILFSSVACRKHKQLLPDNPYGLPHATQTGANIFACRINGQNFIAFNDNEHLDGTFHLDTLRIGGMANKYYLQTILFQLSSNLSEGNIYSINNTTTIGKYITDSLCTGLI